MSTKNPTIKEVFTNTKKDKRITDAAVKGYDRSKINDDNLASLDVKFSEFRKIKLKDGTYAFMEPKTDVPVQESKSEKQNNKIETRYIIVNEFTPDCIYAIDEDGKRIILREDKREAEDIEATIIQC